MDLQDITSRVKKIVGEHLVVEDAAVTESESFINLGGDSLDSVEIVMRLEDEFGLDIPDEAAEKITSVQAAIDYVAANAKG